MKKEQFRFKKEMGQNFLTDPSLIEGIAEASLVSHEDGVLEIGPGRGALTCALARRCRKLIAVELDRTLIRDLETTLELYPNAELVEGDILRQDIPALVARLGEPCRVAANLPYNITAPVLEKLLTLRLPILSMAVMVQKEVGEKMRALPGEEGYGPFALMCQYYAQIEEAVYVSREYFTPQPKVDSSFMLLTVREKPPVSVPDEAAFLRLIRICFAMRRKTIQNNLSCGMNLSREASENILQQCGIQPSARAEQLSMSDFAALAAAIA